MSLLYNAFLNQCLDSFTPCPSTTGGSICSFDVQCDGNCRKVNNCVSCLSNIFNDPNHKMRTYNCLPITYTYTLRYLNRYASEIYHILSQCKTLFSQLDNKNIISLGGGPATELIALERLFRDNNTSPNCKYYNFDTNQIWLDLNMCLKDLFYIHHLNPDPVFQNNIFDSSNSLLNETKLIILNYVISDIYKHTLRSQVNSFFDSVLTQIFNNMPIDTYILINDANSRYMGRDEIEDWSDKMLRCFPNSKIYKGYFNYPSREDYIRFNHSSVCVPSNLFVFCNINQDFLTWQSNVNECRSAFVLIKKK